MNNKITTKQLIYLDKLANHLSKTNEWNVEKIKTTVYLINNKEEKYPIGHDELGFLDCLLELLEMFGGPSY